MLHSENFIHCDIKIIKTGRCILNGPDMKQLFIKLEKHEMLIYNVFVHSNEITYLLHECLQRYNFMKKIFATIYLEKICI